MEQRISFITLAVQDLARSEAFYAALGWTPSGSGVPGQIVFFQLNGIVLGLFGRQDLADDAGLPNSPSQPFSGVTISHNVRSEAEVETALAEAVAAGATVLKPPHKAHWGGRIAYFADPDGHAWEVCFNPFAPLAEDGSVRLGK
jgi:hypothetical protein